MGSEVRTPYGTIYRSGDREWFAGSLAELEAAKAWEEYNCGPLVDGFDYDLQIWVVGGVIQRCGHTEVMACLCNGRRYAGMLLADVLTAQSGTEVSHG